MTVVLWDSHGTLPSLEPVRARFAALGNPDGLEARFERTIHAGAALTLAGEFRPFAELAEATLPTALAKVGLPPDERGPLEALREELRPHDDAADVLDAARIASSVVTNGGREATERALAHGGIGDRFRGIVSIDGVVWLRARRPLAALAV